MVAAVGRITLCALVIYLSRGLISVFKASNEELIEKFSNLITRKDVADLLEISEKGLIYYLYRIRPENMYKSFIIPKKAGGFREINAPTGYLKIMQKKLAYILNLIYTVKPPAYGFIRNRNILMNAQQHLNKKYVLNVDLNDFFTSINFGRVRGMFIKKPYSIGEEAATVLAQIACFNGILPQGAPSSPIITNMICSPLDTKLIKFAKKYGITYTRYADDLSFSSRKKFVPPQLATIDCDGKVSIGEELRSIIEASGFKINEKKIHLKFQHMRQEVTGIVVNEFPNIKRKYIKEIRAILYDCEKNGIVGAAKRYVIKKCKLDILKHNDDYISKWFQMVMYGKLCFVESVKGKTNYTFVKYAEKYNKIFNDVAFNNISISDLNNVLKRYSDKVFIIESDCNQGTGFLLKDFGLITCYHVIKDINESLFKVYKCDSPKPIQLLLHDSLKKYDENIDYAIFNFKTNENSFDIGDSRNIKIGDIVKILGFPNYCRGDSIYIQEGRVTSVKNNYFGAQLYTISARIQHGASGGPVLDKDNKVIGIIKGGAESYADEDDSVHGFLPIHYIKND